MNPAMIAVWILGPLLAWLTGAYLDTWLQIKFVLVIIMSGMHGLFVRCWRGFRRGPQHPPGPLLPDHERSSGGADGADRDPGQGPAVWRLRPAIGDLNRLKHYCGSLAAQRDICKPGKSGYNSGVLPDPRGPQRSGADRRAGRPQAGAGQNQPLR